MTMERGQGVLAVGPQRDYAMREANKALIDTQTAMAWMYDDQLARASASRGASAASAADARGSVSSRAGGSVGAGADPTNEVRSRGRGHARSSFRGR